MSVEARRLIWRCRRGMLELDILLAGFVTRTYAKLSAEQLASFNELLNYADNDLWDLITTKIPSCDAYQQQVLCLLRENMYEEMVA